MTSRPYIRRGDAERILRRGEASVRALGAAFAEQAGVRLVEVADEDEARRILEVTAIVAALDRLQMQSKREFDAILKPMQAIIASAAAPPLPPAELLEPV